MLALHILFRNWSFITRSFVLNDELIFSVLSVLIRYLGVCRVLILICEYDKICSISYDSV